MDRFSLSAKEAHAGVPVSAITSAALAQIAQTSPCFSATGVMRLDMTIHRRIVLSTYSIHNP